MEVAPFHPHPIERMRLVSVALFLALAAARAGAYSVWALPSILLCGARTFLCRQTGSLRPDSDGLADFEFRF
jgi:hypothetical protein